MTVAKLTNRMHLVDHVAVRAPIIAPLIPLLARFNSPIDGYDDARFLVLNLHRHAGPGLNRASPTIHEKPHALALAMRAGVVPGGTRC